MRSNGQARCCAHNLPRGVGWACAVASLCLMAVAPAACAQSGTGGAARVDNVFLIDVSGSMAGRNGAPNIFPRVQEAILQFVAGLDPDSHLYFFPFDDSIHDERDFTIPASRDISQIRAYVSSLQARGQRTAIFNSIATAMERVRTQGLDKQVGRYVCFYIYTDGEDNVSRDWSMRSILSHFNLECGPNGWMFFTTLGLPRNATTEENFRNFDSRRFVYVSEGVGRVQPIRQIQVDPPRLVFGSLLQSLQADRFIVFRAVSALPAGFSVRIVPMFGDVGAQGGLTDVSPQVVPLQLQAGETLKQDIKLSLSNAQSLPEREYSGALNLVSSDPTILLIPDSIPAHFLFLPPFQVKISPAQSVEFPLEFDKLKLPIPAGTKQTLTLVLSFNAVAIQAKEGITVTLVQDSSNPRGLILGQDLQIQGIHGETGWIPAKAGGMNVVLQPSPQVREGKYKGRILFESETVNMLGDGLRSDKDPARKYVEWSFVIAPKPWPFWVWGILIAVILAAASVLGRRMTRPPVLKDLRIEVTTPERTEIDLSGMISMRFGASGDVLPGCPGNFEIRAKKKGKQIRARLEVKSGEMRIKKSAAKADSAVICSEDIYDGDVLICDKYRMRVSSFSLVREDF